MSRTVVLDSGPLGMVTHRGGVDEIDACKRWLADLLGQGVRIIVPEIALLLDPASALRPE